jgi:hypothetical protein
MFDSSLIDKLRSIISQEYVRRSLIKYFSDKGYTNFTVSVYPPSVQDIGTVIPELANKVEVVPFVREFNPATGKAIIGWNLFVLGNNRMDLGESKHSSVFELQHVIKTSGYGGKQTPKDIIEFILNVLSTSKFGIINTENEIGNVMPNVPLGKPSSSGQFYQRKHSS